MLQLTQTPMALTKSVLNAAHARAVFGRRIRVLAAHLARELPANGKILDVGAGDGSLARLVATHRPDVAIEGIDVLIRPQTLIQIKQFDGHRIPYADRSVDVVMFVDVLHHTTDPAALLAEAARVTRQFIVIKDHLREGLLANKTLRVMDWVGNYGHDVVLPYNYLAKAEWDGIFRRLHLHVDHWTDRLGIYPWPVTLITDRQLHFIARLATAGN
jgi:SAM-dependent methyltransferase